MAGVGCYFAKPAQGREGAKQTPSEKTTRSLCRRQFEGQAKKWTSVYVGSVRDSASYRKLM
jgi:hypothetical protein